ncbi:MAG: hypothetical protein WCO94_10600 [Verrucomicrobiota bacterium]
MRLFLDLDTRSFIESAQFQRTVSSLVLKRRDHLPVDVQFLRSGVVVELASGASGKLGLKADKDFNGSFAASDLEWTKFGTGDATTYRFDLNLNTVQINALFAGVPTPSSVALMLEIEWAEADLRTSSNTLAVTLENDIVRGDEGVAEEGGPVYPLPGTIELIARKGQNSGYAGLDGSGKVPVAQLPHTSASLYETLNRFTAAHTGWKVGDIIRQLGDSSAAALQIEITGAVPGSVQEVVEITALAVPEGETSGFQLSSYFGSSDQVTTSGPLTAGEHATAIYSALVNFGSCSTPHGENADALTFTFNSPGTTGASLSGGYANLNVVTPGVDQLEFGFYGNFYDQNGNNYSAYAGVYGPMPAEGFAQEIANSLTNNIPFLNVAVNGTVVTATYNFSGQLPSQPNFYDPIGNGQLWQASFTDGISGVPPGTFIVSDASALGNAGGYKGIGDTVDFLSGYGAPSNSVGSLGNGYVDLNNGDFYHRSDSGWFFVLNIKGPQGPQGGPGPQGITGAQGPVGKSVGSIKTLAPSVVGTGTIRTVRCMPGGCPARFIAVGDNKMLSYWARNGSSTSWGVNRTLPGSGNIMDVAWNNGTFVAVGSGGAIWTSADGATWASQTSGISETLNAVVWQPHISQWIAAGATGRILTSSDGIAWTARTVGTAAYTEIVNGSGGAYIMAFNGTMVFTNNGTSFPVCTGEGGATLVNMRALYKHGSGSPVMGFDRFGYSMNAWMGNSASNSASIRAATTASPQMILGMGTFAAGGSVGVVANATGLAAVIYWADTYFYSPASSAITPCIPVTDSLNEAGVPVPSQNVICFPHLGFSVARDGTISQLFDFGYPERILGSTGCGVTPRRFAWDDSNSQLLVGMNSVPRIAWQWGNPGSGLALYTNPTF